MSRTMKFGEAITQLLKVTEGDPEIAKNKNMITEYLEKHLDDSLTKIAWEIYLREVGLKKQVYQGVRKYFWIAEDVIDGKSYEADTSAELAEKLDFKTSSVVNVRRSGKLLHRRYKITRKKKKAQ